MPRPEFSLPGTKGSGEEVGSNVKSNSAKAIKFVDASQTISTSSGGSTTFSVRAPAGKVWTIQNVWLQSDAISNTNANATTGDHALELRSEKNYISATKASNAFDTILVFKWGYWKNASKQDPPAGGTAYETLTGLSFDDTNGVQLAFTNNTDVSVTDHPVTLSLWVEEETVNG